MPAPSPFYADTADLGAPPPVHHFGPIAIPQVTG
jgi:hypothetical protein